MSLRSDCWEQVMVLERVQLVANRRVLTGTHRRSGCLCYHRSHMLSNSCQDASRHRLCHHSRHRMSHQLLVRPLLQIQQYWRAAQ